MSSTPFPGVRLTARLNTSQRHWIAVVHAMRRGKQLPLFSCVAASKSRALEVAEEWIQRQTPATIERRIAEELTRLDQQEREALKDRHAREARP